MSELGLRKRLFLLCLALLLGLTSPANADSVKRLQNENVLAPKEEDTGMTKFSPQVNVTEILTPKPPADPENPEIYFSADQMENNQEQETITALGHVEIIRNNLTVFADKVIYNQKEDIVTAVGNVVLVEEDGNVVFSDYVELTDKMSKGDMKNVKVIMKDKTRIAASTFRRGDKDKKIMTNVVYTPCDVCRGKDPLWQIKARKVEHNAEEQDVNYQNATLELKGIPVFYTPFLSHPDPTVKRRSGFLFPTISSNSYLGAAVQPRYFWNISDQEDILFNPIISTDKGIVYGGAYRKYLHNGKLNMSGTYLRDPDTKENRGNLFLDGRYEINDFWVADTEINYASDSAYLKDLSLDHKDDAWLTSKARLQGFDFRNYATLEGYYFKQLSYDLRNIESPTVLPFAEYENISRPDKYGAYTRTNLSMASVTRADDSSAQRMTMINAWNLPYTSPYGEKYRLTASLKSDLYYVDNYTYEKNENFDGAVARIFPQVGLEWRLPFVRATEDSRQILEPVVVAVAAPNQDNKPEKIPNEDSQDVELTDTNILDLDRYSGYDRNDTGSRISYGLNWSAYGNTYGRTSFFLAQSYKFDKDESFSEAEGQTGSFTDYVGRVYASPNEYFDLNYRFKLDKSDLDISYSELSSRVGSKVLSAYIAYIYFPANNASSLDYKHDRKELYTAVQAALTKNWSIRVYNRQDLTDKGGSLEHGGKLTYDDECSTFDFLLRQEDSNNPNYEGDFEFSFTFFLKTLGGAGSR